MAEETETIATLLARKEYVRAVPLLKKDLAKYPGNVRIRLQYADALAGSGDVETALEQYEETSKYYEDNGLTVQSIAVRKKSEKLRAAQIDTSNMPTLIDQRQPSFAVQVPRSPLFEHLTEEDSGDGWVIGDDVLLEAPVSEPEPKVRSFKRRSSHKVA